jgi:hypothetical protein
VRLEGLAVAVVVVVVKLMMRMIVGAVGHREMERPPVGELHPNGLIHQP